MFKRASCSCGLAVALATATVAGERPTSVGLRAPGSVNDSLARDFRRPAPSARPWVYWFWLNGNITSNGITADLEAMQRAGVGGVLIMEVDQGAPVGPAGFMSSEWRALFKHVCTEAQRLGLEVNMNNDAGWNGSGGPWIKPEQSMQKIVWSETNVAGPIRFEGVLAQPPAIAGFYRDLTVLAFPTPGSYRIDGLKTKAAFEAGGVGPVAITTLPAEMIIERDRIVELRSALDREGRLAWDVPPGQWTLVRFGHTSTGVENAPAPASGRGLECDKLSRAGVEANFDGMMRQLIADSAPLAGKSLAATHVDSWENGSQNWTVRMREEFRERRGYDLWPFLPVVTGRVVGSLEISERFLWDLRRTVSELVVENYAGHLHELAHAQGLRFTIEAYGGPCDDLPYGGQADEPMCEFWMGGGALETCKGMASAAHIYGRRIVGAESFTAGDQERWRDFPGSIKALGDRAFCDGVNRFVFHRYAMQPWQEDRRPGMTMGPWGLHYERTQTWWEQSRAWHEYLARCQFMLRQGLFVADLCYLQAEMPPQGFVSHSRLGYDWDEGCAEVVLTRMSVNDGRIVLPDGMNYGLLVLADAHNMTPALLRKLKELVEAGATIVGPRPLRSPSLSGYPKCDEEVQALAGELWGNCDGQSVKEHRFGHGRVVWGVAPEKLLADSGVGPDFTSAAGLRYLHRWENGTDIYFVANSRPQEVTTVATFRVTGRLPELWQPETGQIERAAMFEEKAGTTSVLLHLGPSGSVFVVFRAPARKADPIVAVSRNGELLWPAAKPGLKFVVQKAVYGILNDPARTREVREKVQRLVDGGETSFTVARMAEGDDPAVNVVKTLIVEYTVGDERATVTGTDPETVTLAPPIKSAHLAELRANINGRVLLDAWEPGNYECKTASGETRRFNLPSLPAPLEVGGPWEVRFAPGGGAPEHVTLDKLISWHQHAEPGVKYFSGTATYTSTVRIPPDRLGKDRRLYLDLGNVAVMAEVKLNGRALGTLWKGPYRVDITPVARPGNNALEVKVVSLWINRMIGDEQLPEDSDRNPDGTLKSWPRWLAEGKPSPAGRFTFTSWRLWKKDAPLQESGLLGPVTLRSSRQALIAVGPAW